MDKKEKMMEHTSAYTRIAIAVQFGLLAAKLLGLAQWPWLIILFPAEIFVALAVMCALAYCTGTITCVMRELMHERSSKRKRKKQSKKKEQIIKAYDLGESIDDIALELGLTSSDVYDIVSAYRTEEAENHF